MTNNKERKYIYVVLSSTPYKTGKLVKIYKRTNYGHASFSLEPTLSPMYAFSRKHEHSTFNAGFVEESLLRYQCQKVDSDIMVARLPISNEQYDKAKQLIEKIKKEKEEYIYNFFSLVAAAFYDGYVEIDRSYTCIEFVCYFLKEIGVYKSKNPSPSFNDFERVLKKYTIYEGKSKKYRIGDSWGGDEFVIYQPKLEYIASCGSIVRSLAVRCKNKKKL